MLQFPGVRYRVPGFWCQLVGSRCQVEGSQCQVTGFQVPCSRFQVPCSRFQVPCSCFQVPGSRSRCHVAVSRYHVAGSQPQYRYQLKRIQLFSGSELDLSIQQHWIFVKVFAVVLQFFMKVFRTLQIFRNSDTGSHLRATVYRYTVCGSETDQLRIIPPRSGNTSVSRIWILPVCI